MPFLVAGLLIVAAAAILGGLTIGTRTLPLDTALGALVSSEGRVETVLVWTLRLPRSLAAFMSGAGLALAGYLLQTVTRNPLAGPGLTGVTAGAVTPIVACFVFLPSLSSVWYPIVGFVGGLVAAAVTFSVAAGRMASPLHLALGGISVSLFLNAVTTYCLLVSGPQVPSLLFWLSGGLQGRSWPEVAAMAPWVAIGLCGAFAARRVVGLLALSDHAAAGMGLHLARWRPVLLALAVLPVAGVVPVAGPIAFVGLASPHIARLLRPPGPGWTMALAVAIGGLTVVVADLLARSLAAPRELPIGIMTALLGGPVFLYLVQRPDGFAAKVGR
ncbi:FecCD family ABC transporter permease [Aureimonas pseudogalii]|uniref:Iron complex transport system permease protein n=1 Tax=Aureimonas pseudogalii TaxID=1744844 RepID=A0A7W6MMC7_9HYPH|nr:iron ABC transporter permease [Aureimonas pseudogalii]MBB4000705.1 iron complex transport system permease protein [Aureimonas pseudogalii]